LMCTRKRRRYGQGETDAMQEAYEVISRQRVDRRYETVEGWLISKRVMAHDKKCQACMPMITKNRERNDRLKRNDASTEQQQQCCQQCGGDDARGVCTNSNNSNNSHDVSSNNKEAPETQLDYQVVTHESTTNDEECQSTNPECPICLQDLQVNQIVSWSTNPSCQHVFHHECIKEWLLRRIDCPFCRETFLPVDAYRGKDKHVHMDDMLTQHTRRNTTTFYCIQEGLVCVPTVIRCTRRELDLLQERICTSIVRRSDLALMRGAKNEASLLASLEGSLSTVSSWEVVENDDDDEEVDGNDIGSGDDVDDGYNTRAVSQRSEHVHDTNVDVEQGDVSVLCLSQDESIDADEEKGLQVAQV
jgi:Ring finger domain